MCPHILLYLVPTGGAVGSHYPSSAMEVGGITLPLLSHSGDHSTDILGFG